MMMGGSLWPIVASLAVQGAPGDGASPPADPPPAGQPMPAEPALDELISPPPPVEWQEMVGDDLVIQLIEGRRRPGYNPDLPDPLSQDNEGALRQPPHEDSPGIVRNSSRLNIRHKYTHR